MTKFIICTQTARGKLCVTQGRNVHAVTLNTDINTGCRIHRWEGFVAENQAVHESNDVQEFFTRERSNAIDDYGGREQSETGAKVK